MTDRLYCEQCGAELKPRHVVWLELDFTTGLYSTSVPSEKSQGLFPFGSDCAAEVLLNGGVVAHRRVKISQHEAQRRVYLKRALRRNGLNVNNEERTETLVSLVGMLVHVKQHGGIE